VETSKVLRPLGHSCAALALACSGGAAALGLGEISVDSGLNERFAASIPLLSPSRDQRDTVSVHIARAEDFQRAGVEWTRYMSTLRFRLLDGPDGTRVVVDSDEPVREPYLNLVVEASWAGGRLLRQYTVLLDPPRELNLWPAAAGAAAIKPAAGSHPAPVPAATSTPAPIARRAEALFQYGPVRAHEQPRAIAARLHPGPGITPEQVELALYRANPQAFNHGRLDHMVPGAMLSVPPADAIRTVSPEAARALILGMRARLGPGRAQAAPPHPAAAQAKPALALAPPAPLSKAHPPASAAAAPRSSPAGAAHAVAASGPRAMRQAEPVMGPRQWATLRWILSGGSVLIALCALGDVARARRRRMRRARPETAAQPAAAAATPALPSSPPPPPPAIDGSVQGLLQDAEFCQLYGHFADAAQLIETVVAKSPDDQDLRFRLAEAYFVADMQEPFRRIAAALEGQLDQIRQQKLAGMIESLSIRASMPGNGPAPGCLAA
jgi:pilus assembly protein FimV